jgi:dienelactone hydrolase
VIRNVGKLRMGVLAVVMAVIGAVPGTAHAASAIESHYNVAGPWAVTTADVTDASGQVVYKLYRPAALGAGGFHHPIVTWGNGTGATPDMYPGVLNRLASWGFAVIASTDTTTGTGAEILSAAQYLAARNADPASVFYGKLDTGRIGAVGHSQGAGGVVNATTHSNGLITTVVPIALPARIWVSPGDEYYPAQITCPVLFLGAGQDIIISSPSTIRGFYDEVPGAAAMAVLTNADHNTIQNTGGGFLGYLTAWLMYRLQGDTYARGAFAGATPEINTNTAWKNQAEKNLG